MGIKVREIEADLLFLSIIPITMMMMMIMIIIMIRILIEIILYQDKHDLQMTQYKARHKHNTLMF